MADSHSARTKAFISYSHADEKYLERLNTHLEYYIRELKLDIWSDRRISAGAKWKDEIKTAIASAKVAILLLSADFFASKFIADNELPPLLEAAQQEGLIIFQIILSPCPFKNSRLADYQAINSPSGPLIRMPKAKQEEIWSKLAEQVATALESASLHREKSDASPKTTEQGPNEKDKHNDSKREQTASGLSPQLSRTKLKNIQLTTELIGHEAEVTALALSPDNQTLISGDEKGQVRVWDMAQKTSFVKNYSHSIFTRMDTLINTLFGISKAVNSIVFHPEGRAFLVGWRTGRAILSVLHSAQDQKIDLIGVGGLTSIAISSDGLFCVHAGHAVKRQEGHSRGSLPVSPESSLGGFRYPMTDKEFDAAKNFKYVHLFQHYNCEESTPSIAFSPKGRFFAASSSTGTIRLWDIIQEEEGLTLMNKTGSRDSFLNIAFHPEEKLIAAIDKEGECLIWDVPMGIIQNTLIPLSGKTTAIAFSSDGYHLATAHSSGRIGFWSSSSGELLHTIQAHNQSISTLVYSHDGDSLISGSIDKTIKVWGWHRNYRN